ncbi:MAG: serine hydrolase domain-containing protein, partial [Saprospiraceae bacterium]
PTLMRYKFPTVPLAWKEGATYSYQNAVFCVVEEMMKAATGESYQALLNEKIFRPANMLTASCDYPSICATADKALPNIPVRGGGWKADVITEHYYNATAAGGVNASIADMGEWLKVLLGHRPEIVSNSVLDQVFTPMVKTGRERQIFPGWINRDDASYAMGWRVLQHGNDTILYHSGSVNGFRAEIALNRRDGIAVCMLFNACTSVGKDCVPAFFDQWEQSRAGILAWAP